MTESLPRMPDDPATDAVIRSRGVKEDEIKDIRCLHLIALALDFRLKGIVPPDTTADGIAALTDWVSLEGLSS